MCSASRTDVHRPSTIVPADYAYVLSYGCGAQTGDRPVGVDKVRALIKAGDVDTHRSNSAWNCTVCGAQFSYGDVFQHIPSRRLILVGHICGSKYGLLADRAEWYMEAEEAQALTAREIEARMLAERKDALLADYPELPTLLETDHYIVRDMRARFEKIGRLSEKQLALLRKLADEATNPAPKASVPEGRREVEGRVVSIKADEFYGTLRMLVEIATDDGTYRVFGTVPRGLNATKGADVRFTATLARSGGDASFGFFKRPSKASVL